MSSEITSHSTAQGHSRKFHQLNRDFNWYGTTVALKVPVIHLNVFPEDVKHYLVSTISDTSSVSSVTASGSVMESRVTPSNTVATQSNSGGDPPSLTTANSGSDLNSRSEPPSLTTANSGSDPHYSL